MEEAHTELELDLLGGLSEGVDVALDGFENLVDLISHLGMKVVLVWEGMSGEMKKGREQQEGEKRKKNKYRQPKVVTVTVEDARWEGRACSEKRRLFSLV